MRGGGVMEDDNDEKCLISVEHRTEIFMVLGKTTGKGWTKKNVRSILCTEFLKKTSFRIRPTYEFKYKYKINAKLQELISLFAI